MRLDSLKAINELNSKGLAYLTENLVDPKTASDVFEGLLEKMGNVVEAYPSWHPLLTSVPARDGKIIRDIDDMDEFPCLDHTTRFMRGFLSCIYNRQDAQMLMTSAKMVPGVKAELVGSPLYSDKALPVMVYMPDIMLEKDGTIASSLVTSSFLKQALQRAESGVPGVDWWTARADLLGLPFQDYSSVFVNRTTGKALRTFLETMNETGLFGKVREWVLGMYSEEQLYDIGMLMVQSALIAAKDQKIPNSQEFTFDLRGHSCKGSVNDCSDIIFIKSWIGEDWACRRLGTEATYYITEDRISLSGVFGEQALAENFL